MLKSKIIAAVAQAKLAIQDLALRAFHVAKGAAIFVPGRAPTYPETLTSVSIVFTSFKTSEIDGDRIQASDWRGLVFAEVTNPVFKVSDVIRISLTSGQINSGDYRILFDDKIMAGDTVVLHQLHLRRL